MPDKPPPSLFPARQTFNRGSDVRDAMAEMAERAQAISQEAGTKIASAMRDVIGAAAGVAGFAVESARDLVQYMVRRGQITQDEADRLIREAEEAHGRRPGARVSGKASVQPAPKQQASSSQAEPKPAKKPAAKRAAAEKKPAAKKPPAKKRR
jgi:polyhydroxyalkanoate synthesis regulator phasin